ncbi:MAG: RhoGAP domain-containing protein [Chlamydiales bacterium]
MMRPAQAVQDSAPASTPIPAKTTVHSVKGRTGGSPPLINQITALGVIIAALGAHIAQIYACMIGAISLTTVFVNAFIVIPVVTCSFVALLLWEASGVVSGVEQSRKMADEEPIPQKQPITQDGISKAHLICSALDKTGKTFKTGRIGRLSTSPQEKEKAKKLIQDRAFEQLSQCEIHALMSVLNEHYREMNLLGGESARPFIQIGQNFKGVNVEQMSPKQKADAIKQLRQLMITLPSEYLPLLSFVRIYHQIMVVHKKQTEEKKGLTNLAIVAYPNLLQLTPSQIAAYKDELIKASELLIANFNEVFYISHS